MHVRDEDAAELLWALLEELRALGEEAVRQTELLERILRKLDSV